MEHGTSIEKLLSNTSYKSTELKSSPELLRTGSTLLKHFSPRLRLIFGTLICWYLSGHFYLFKVNNNVVLTLLLALSRTLLNRNMQNNTHPFLANTTYLAFMPTVNLSIRPIPVLLLLHEIPGKDLPKTVDLCLI